MGKKCWEQNNFLERKSSFRCNFDWNDVPVLFIRTLLGRMWSAVLQKLPPTSEDVLLRQKLTELIALKTKKRCKTELKFSMKQRSEWSPDKKEGFLFSCFIYPVGSDPIKQINKKSALSQKDEPEHIRIRLSFFLDYGKQRSKWMHLKRKDTTERREDMKHKKKFNLSKEKK